MGRTLLASSIMLIGSLMGNGHVRAQQIGQLGLGLVSAKQICAECHAVEKGPSLSPNAAAPRFEDIANIPGMTATALAAALQTSHRTMPNLVLDSGQLANIVAYIQSLKRTN